MTRNAWILSKETRRRRGWVGGRWGRQSMCLRLLVSTHQRRVRLGGLRGPLHEAPAGPLLSADGCMQYHPARKSGDAPPSLHCSEHHSVQECTADIDARAGALWPLLICRKHMPRRGWGGGGCSGLEASGLGVEVGGILSVCADSFFYAVDSSDQFLIVSS